MAINIVNPDVEQRLRAFAAKRGLKLTEAVGVAIAEADNVGDIVSRQERLARIRAAGITARAQLAALSNGPGLPADKAFYDWLSGEE